MRVTVRAIGVRQAPARGTGDPGLRAAKSGLRSSTSGAGDPDCAALHPGYDPTNNVARMQRSEMRVNEIEDE
jgi:hypothetical protein